MQKRIETGCLAVIIGARHVPANIGKTVTVSKFVAPGEVLRHQGYVTHNNSNGPAWLVESEGVMALKDNSQLDRIGWALIAEYNLRRIDDYKPDADDLALYNRHGKLESSNPCQTKQSRFTTRAS